MSKETPARFEPAGAHRLILIFPNYYALAHNVNSGKRRMSGIGIYSRLAGEAPRFPRLRPSQQIECSEMRDHQNGHID
jgi:hypothetical protein